MLLSAFGVTVGPGVAAGGVLLWHARRRGDVETAMRVSSIDAPSIAFAGAQRFDLLPRGCIVGVRRQP